MIGARLPHRPGLDRIRGAAVVSAVAYHLGYLPGGFLGVDVFFVLSGYLVTSLLLAEVQGRSAPGSEGVPGAGRSVDLVSFWRARFRRLAPAVLVLVPGVLALAWLVRWPTTRFDELAVDGAATLTWWQNWRLIVTGQSYWDPNPSPFRHAWSLAIEEQFYALWPLLLALLVGVLVARRGKPAHRSAHWSARRVVGALAALSAVAGAAWHLVLSHRVTDSDLSRVYLGSDTRAFALLVGCTLATSRWGLWAQSRRDRRPSLVAPAAAAGLCVMAATVHVDDAWFFRGGGFVLTALLAAVVVAHQARPAGQAHQVRPVRSDHLAGESAHQVGTWAATAPRRLGPLATTVGATFTWLGQRSYGIYLWSWPLQVLAAHRWPEVPGWVLAVAVVAASLVVAEGSYRLVEHPLRRRRGWAARPALRRGAWAGGVVVSVAAILAALGAATVAPVHQRMETAESLELASAAPTTTVVDPGPVPGLGVLVLGDSVSFTIGLYKPNPFRVPAGIAWIDSRAVIGCGLLAAEGWDYPDEDGVLGPPSGGDCVIQADVERLGLAQEPDVVVMFPGAWEVFPARSPSGDVVDAQSPEMAEALEGSLVARAQAAHDVGASFVVVAWACPGEGTPANRSDPDFIAWVNGVFRDAMAKARGQGVDARLIEPGTESCAGGLDGEPTEARRSWMADSNHVVGQEQGERFWYQWLGPLLSREFGPR